MLRNLTVFFFLITAYGQRIPDRFIVELEGQPAASTKTSGRRLADVRQQHTRMRAVIESTQAEVLDSFQTVANAMVVRVPGGDRRHLESLAGVRKVWPVYEYKLVLDRAIPLQRIPDAWAAVGGQSNAGKGIKIGIIDSGINARHAGFQTSNLPAVDGFPRVNFATDLTLTNNKVIVARSYGSRFNNSANDIEGHGTAVAMIAAGITNSTPLGDITGIAPGAYLGNYKVFPDNGSATTDLIVRALEDAIDDGMDVINMSLGLQPAPRMEDDLLVQAVQRASAGAIVVVAASNDGPDLNTIASPANAVDALTVGNSLNDRIFATSVRQSDSDRRFVSIAADGPTPSPRQRAGALVDVAGLDPTRLVCAPLPTGSLTGAVALIQRGTCTFEEKLNNVQGAGAAAAVVITNSQPVVGMARGNNTLPAMMVSTADGDDLKSIAASGTNQVVLDFQRGPVYVNPDALSDSSSSGPNQDGGIKPDLVAVGENVLTAAAGSLGTAGYTVASGTSLSAPMVSGAAAVLKGFRP
ncbi:MAG TPA: S8 family serine peptidase, partial [Bryobacteraceae bacterium]|nr:S8 family serine peptidase [Bryobacteraceae bacterium]